MNIFKACHKGDINHVRKLLRCGYNPSMCDSKGKSLLYVACMQRHSNVVKLLIEYGADVKNPGDLLHMLCRSDNYEIIRLLIHNGCDVNVMDGNGRSPLYYACWYRKIVIAKTLISSGAKVDLSTNETPLYSACHRGDIEIVDLLLSNGANANIICFGKSPLYISCECGYFEISSLLINYNANMNERCVSGETPLHSACTSNHPQMVELLLQSGIDPNIHDNFGNTALSISCDYGYTSIIKFLLRRNVVISNGLYIHPLIKAVSLGNIDVVRLLLDDGCNPNSIYSCHGHLAIHVACVKKPTNYLEIIDLLLDNGANINAHTKDGMTVMELTSTDTDLVNYLSTK